MPADGRPGPLDRLVEHVAQAMNSLGLNGTRLLWKWRQKRQQFGETGFRGEILWRSARGRHKMCPACRSLVERTVSRCPECGESLHAVQAPGVGRLVVNLVPGITAAASLITLVNGFWFATMILAQIRSGSASGMPLFGFDPEFLVRFGSGLSRPTHLPGGGVAGGEWWRLVTAMFLHAGLLHFVFNTFLLIQLGPLVEEAYGTARFWIVYLSCGVAGSLTSQLPRFVNTVGASGAIMGLIGLLLVHGYRHGGSLLGQSMKNLLVRLVIYSVILSLAFPGIDHLNHAGGLAAGALLALVVPFGPPPSRGAATFWQLLALAGVLLVLVAFYHVAVQARSAVAS